MESDLPKVCHPIGGRPMVCAVVDACLAAGCERIVVVVGYKQELVRDALASYATSHPGRIDFAVQSEQLGTGHAVVAASGHFATTAPATPVFVLCGDGPLIRPETLGVMLDSQTEADADTPRAATLATSVLPDPSGYGRIVRDELGVFRGIIEQKNATPAQLAIREVNPSYYCFASGSLFGALGRVQRNEASGEYYLTDVPGLLLSDGESVAVIDAVPPEDVMSINTPQQLAEVDRVYRARSGTGAGVGSA